MKDDSFDRMLKNALQEKAPAGFTDKILDKLEAERQAQKITAPYKLPGKGILIFLFGLFGFVILAAIYFGNTANSNPSIFNSIERFIPEIHFQFGHSVKQLVFSIAAICGFLVVDYIIRTRKLIRI